MSDKQIIWLCATLGIVGFGLGAWYIARPAKVEPVIVSSKVSAEPAKSPVKPAVPPIVVPTQSTRPPLAPAPPPSPLRVVKQPPPKLNTTDPKALLAAVTEFAPVVVQRLEARSKKLNLEMRAKAPSDDLEVTNTYKVAGCDVRQTTSLIEPVVAVVLINWFYWSKSRQFPAIAGGSSTLLTIELVPEVGGEWRCVKATARVESDHPVGNQRSRQGEASDWTESMREALAIK